MMIDATAVAQPISSIYRLTVEQYQRMIAAGIIAEDAPVELLEGWLVEKMSKNPPHIGVLGLVRRAIERLLTEEWYLNVEQPIAVVDSMPEPGCSVIRGNIRDFMDRIPAAADTALVIEISSTTLAGDRGQKLRVYARSGIPLYWIVNLTERQIEVYSKPRAKGELSTYLERQTYEADASIPVMVDGKALGAFKVADVLP